jgi:hypothetical protein
VLSGLHARAWLLPCAPSSDLDRPRKENRIFTKNARLRPSYPTAQAKAIGVSSIDNDAAMREARTRI